MLGSETSRSRRGSVHRTIDIGNGLAIKVYDARGMFEALEDEETEAEMLRMAGSVCLNDINGVLLICIPMHERHTRDTSRLLNVLHKEYHDKDIWRFVVIALTKADEYPKKKWLAGRKKLDSPKPFLIPMFEECLSNAKESLEHIFTSDRGQIKMSKEEFHRIPVLPTSELEKERMHVIDGCCKL